MKDLVPLPGSGSHRKYFRQITSQGSRIVVQGTSLEENKAFITFSRHFRGKGLNVPEVYEVSQDGLSYVQEDLGDTSLFDLVAAGRKSGNYSPEESALLKKTIAQLPRIQFLGADGLDWSVCYPQEAFDARMVDFDLNYFKYCFLKGSGLEFDEAPLQDDFEKLKADLLRENSDTFLYRDFQARNVMIKDGEPWFIDYQGGRRGPIYYDVASFIWQASSRFPSSLREELVQTYMDALGEFRQVDPEQFRSRLRLFVLFRTLQVLGCYGFRGLFEKKQYFIDSIPPAMDNLRGLLETPFKEYPYLNSVLEQLASLPRFAAKPALEENPPLEVQIYSFSFKKGIPEDKSGNGGGYVFDCRYIHNPGRYDEYKQLCGLDAPVIKFLEDDGEIVTFLDSVYKLVDAHAERFIRRGFTHMQVSFGCTGGQHRSVYCAEHLAEHLAAKYGVKVLLNHREMNIQKVLGR